MILDPSALHWLINLMDHRDAPWLFMAGVFAALAAAIYMASPKDGRS